MLPDKALRESLNRREKPDKTSGTRSIPATGFECEAAILRRRRDRVLPLVPCQTDRRHQDARAPTRYNWPLSPLQTDTIGKWLSDANRDGSLRWRRISRHAAGATGTGVMNPPAACLSTQAQEQILHP